MSFVGIIGSKTGVSKELIGMMPPEAFGQCYIELFAGGAGIFYAKEPAKINVLNDLDPDVVVMHEMVKSNAVEVEAELQSFLDNDDFFNACLELRESDEWLQLPPERRAAFVIYIIKQSVNSNQRSISSSSKSNTSFNPDIDLQVFADRLKHVQIRHMTYEKCIDTYLYRSPEVEAFLFADPPYVVATKAQHYRYNFCAVEHLRFWHRLDQLNRDNGRRRNVKIMLTYDDDPLIRSLYRERDGWFIENLKMGYASAHDPDRCRDEIVITNYTI